MMLEFPQLSKKGVCLGIEEDAIIESPSMKESLLA